MTAYRITANFAGSGTRSIVCSRGEPAIYASLSSAKRALAALKRSLGALAADFRIEEEK